ncbi:MULTISPECIES: RhuM family protein [Rhodomicrobium]|uniref:RhuM family protein n=1 Tax=Rhodomicrobium TaxID=1068 RepID=UPI000B4B0275|nr:MULTISPECIES: RhuM family protein [Rhodomicrobium]
MPVPADLQPLILRHDLETGDRFVMYAKPDGVALELRFEGEEPWATRSQMATLFGRDVSRIGVHINKILAESELEAESNVRKAHIANSDKPVDLYSLDMVLSVGYRVRSSKQAIMFRRWANGILKQFLLKGFILDGRRLENPDGRPDFFDELLAKIRQIRASEKRMWTRVLELASFCSDFHMMKQNDRDIFFATIQNAMHWAVTQETAAEVIHSRVDASKPHAGLTHFRGEIPMIDDARIAKNYYQKAEIHTLNLLTSATLEFFESQAEQRRTTTLAQFLEKMRDFIRLDGRPLIRSDYRGTVTKAAALKKADAEFAAYEERVRLAQEARGEREVSRLLDDARFIAAEKRSGRKPH